MIQPPSSITIQKPTPKWNLRRIAIRVGIPILLFVVAILEGILLGYEQYLLAAFLIVVPLGIFAIELAMRNHHLFPFLILITALFIPLKLSTGRSTPLVLSLILATAFTFLWFIQMLMEHKFAIRSTPINLPLFLFAIAVIISLVWGIAFRDPLINVWGSFPLVQAASTILIVISLSVVLLTGNLVTDPKILKWMVYVFLIAGVLGLIDNLVDFIKLPVNTRGLFAMWIVAITSALAFFNQKLAGWIRILLILLAFSWLYWGYGLNIGWLAGWVPLVAVLLMVGFFRSPKLAILLIVLVIMVALININTLSTAIDLENRGSGLTRLAAWKMNWEITKDHLLFGTGPAGYAVYYMTYFPNQAMATHNNFLDMFAQTGIIGFSLMMWFFIRLVWLGWRLLLRLRDRHDFFEAMAAACLAGTLGGLMMMFFGDWIFPFAYTQTIAGFDYSVYNFIFMGAILSLDQMTSLPLGGYG
jgi:hypothetical protein